MFGGTHQHQQTKERHQWRVCAWGALILCINMRELALYVIAQRRPTIITSQSKKKWWHWYCLYWIGFSPSLPQWAVLPRIIVQCRLQPHAAGALQHGWVHKFQISSSLQVIYCSHGKYVGNIRLCSAEKLRSSQSFEIIWTLSGLKCKQLWVLESICAAIAVWIQQRWLVMSLNKPRCYCRTTFCLDWNKWTHCPKRKRSHIDCLCTRPSMDCVYG